MAVANDIYQKLKAGADFSEMARTRSSDPRTAGRGGDMGWVDTGLFPTDNPRSHRIRQDW